MNKPRFVPPSPEVMAELFAEYLRLDRPQGLTFKQYLAAIGFSNPADNIRGMDDGAFVIGTEDAPELISIPTQPVRGPLPIKVLLIDFPDVQGTLPISHYQDLLFSKESYPTGSLRDYYNEVSLGQVDVSGTIHGWLRMPERYSYYTNGESGTEWDSYPQNAPRMAEDAVRVALANGIDFGPELDVLNQSIVTALFIVHAGLGAERLHPSIQGDHIWSHKWRLRNPISVDPGLFATIYLTVPQRCQLGVCAHELGHLAFQWGDFYDPNYDDDGQAWDGSGDWDLMAGGSYNGNGNRPAHPVSLHKSQHNWMEVEEINSSQQQLRVEPFTLTSGKTYKVISPKYKQDQYLILENRIRTGFDSDLPGEGLLVWRVDESKEQYAPDRPGLQLVQADGRHQLENPNDWNQGDTGDPFPGSADRTELRDTGDISTTFPDGDNSGVALTNIRRDAATGVITLDVEFAGDDGDGEERDTVTVTSEPNLAIPDRDPEGVESVLQVDDEGMIEEIALTVDIRHTYIGDLRVVLVSPSSQVVILHDGSGGSADNLQKTYHSATYPALAVLVGTPAQGEWTLKVTDTTAYDTGVLQSWRLVLGLRRGDNTVQLEVSPGLAIPDADPAGIGSALTVTRAGRSRAIRASVDITHTYISDIRLELIGPAGDRAILHDRVGGHLDDIRKIYNSSDTPSLASLVGLPIRGAWVLRVTDLVGQDVGVLNHWGLEIDLAADVQLFKASLAPDLAIPDDSMVGVGSAIRCPKEGTAQALEVGLDISHTYVGDLRVELVAPSGNRAILRNRVGGRQRDLLLELNSSTSPELAMLVGQPIKGNWILRVMDLEGLDVGILNTWRLQLTYAR